MKKHMSKAGRGFLLVVFTLTCLGLVMTYSASAMFADQRLGNSHYFFMRQLAASFMGFGALMASSFVNPFWIRKHSRFFIGVAFFLLTLVFVPYIGRPAGGAHRWIRIPGFHFQPSEFAKLAVCIYLADYLTRKRGRLLAGKWNVFIGPSILIFMMTGIIIAQPDFGTVVMVLALSAVFFFFAGIRFGYIMGAVALVVPVLIGLVVSKPYRWNRIISFLNPWGDPKGSGFQIIQSYVAFGLGGLKGVGLGGSTQKLFYLPQSHTDFIFAIVGEELGLGGTIGIVILFGLFLYFGVQICAKARDPYLKLVSLGLVVAIILQALVNMMVTTGMLPTKGLPLPFLSYGGSALMFNMIAAGLVLSVDRRTTRQCALL